jgi:hypothetical protein
MPSTLDWGRFRALSRNLFFSLMNWPAKALPERLPSDNRGGPNLGLLPNLPEPNALSLLFSASVVPPARPHACNPAR